MHWKSHTLKSYLIPFVLYQLSMLGWILFEQPLAQMQWVNRWHHPILDPVFFAFTQAAEVYPILLLFAFLFWKKRALFLPALASYALSTLLVQGLKHLVFAQVLRPTARFAQESLTWQLVEGVELLKQNSFPSGHSSVGWFLFFWWSLVVGKPAWAGFFAFLAAGVAFSRIYLFQHFPIDTMAGAAIGLASSMCCYYYLIEKKKHAAENPK